MSGELLVQAKDIDNDGLFTLDLVQGKSMAVNEVAEIESFSFSHVGKVRKDNQDSIRLCNPNDDLTAVAGHLYGVADGMGGYAHGGVASSLALETFFETFYAANGVSPLQKFRVGIQNANLSVYQTAQRLNAGSMGTTLTAVNVVGHDLHIGHVGDSRAYLIRGNKTTCLTNDHTRVGELVRMRILSADKVRTHNQRSVLNRCLGLELFVQPDITKISVQNDDIIILCTDGVWSVIEDKEFAQLTKGKNNFENLSQEIVQLAMDRESDDNLSIVIINLNRLASHNTAYKTKWSWSLPNVFRRIIK
ncbi:MAG: protein phosphatase 2C domain-containing protein [Candidatus Kryptoniota bacterium]